MELVKVNNKEEIINNIFLPKDIDMFEMDATSIEDVLYKFQRYFQVSKETFFIKCEDKVIGIYGIREENEGVGIPWFLSVDIPKKHAMSFLRHSVKKFKDLQREYKLLYNYTSSENFVSHRWLSYLGFSIDTLNPVVISDKKIIYKFEWRCQ